LADVPIPAPVLTRKTSRFGWSPLTESSIVAIIAGVILLALSRLDMTIYNNYVILADAFLHGHVWIDWPGARIDALKYGGAYYIIEGPIPAILLMPLVAILGLRTNETTFTCLFGAIALGAADRVLMLEHAIYSVISPEGCASILWRDAGSAAMAAEALRLTADDLRRFDLVDAVVPEPLGGAHRAPQEMIAAVGDAIETVLVPLLGQAPEALKARRREKFLAMGREGLS